MTRCQQGLDHPGTDHAGGAEHQHPQPGRAWWQALARATVTGSIASLSSTGVISLTSRHANGSAVSGTNATSHWLWGRPARHRRRSSLRHTLPGYLIHHASSLFWAVFHERATAGQTLPPARLAASTAVTAALAYVVDYHVIPSRLNPGFEQRMGAAGLLATYAGFAAGLYAGRRLLDRCPGRRTPAH